LQPNNNRLTDRGWRAVRQLCCHVPNALLGTCDNEFVHQTNKELKGVGVCLANIDAAREGEQADRGREVDQRLKYSFNSSAGVPNCIGEQDISDGCRLPLRRNLGVDWVTDFQVRDPDGNTGSCVTHLLSTGKSGDEYH
jgi:hypothetical protein